MSSPVPVQTIATLATGAALDDLRLLLFSLEHWNPVHPTVYLYCDSAVSAALKKINYKGILNARTVLDKYSGQTRPEMEAKRGTFYDNLWFDFMAEKINLMDWALAEQPDGVLFCDADICFLGPVPRVPAMAQLALSPHQIRAGDEAKYGKYNGGFFWCREPSYLDLWRDACRSARFYEQSALEDIAKVAQNLEPGVFYEFGAQQNYGWWRMWQSAAGPQAETQRWTMNRNRAGGGSGILLDGQPLGSVHTHFGERNDRATADFNAWVIQWLLRLHGGYPPAKRMLEAIQRIFPAWKGAQLKSGGARSG